MSQLINAADAIRASIRQYKALNEFADALEKVGQLEQMELEIKARITKHQADEAAAKLSAGKAQEKVKAAEQRAEDIKAAALSEANQLVADAKAEASKVRSTAKSQAAKALADAVLAVGVREAEAAHKVALAEEQLTDARRGANEAIADKAVAERELAELRSKIEQLKTQYATLFNT